MVIANDEREGGIRSLTTTCFLTVFLLFTVPDVQAREKIYDVAVSASGTVGFRSYWQDPDFDHSRHAFYYLRVLEVPKPRWTTLEAQRLNVTAPAGVPTKIQDRAYSSPIWYSP